MNYYTYKRFLCKIEFLNPYLKTIRYLFYLAFLGMGIYFASQNYDIFHQKLLYLASYSIGLLFMLFVVAVLYDLFYLSAKKVPFNEKRRYAMKVVFDVTMVVLAFSYMLRGIVGGLKEPKIVKQKIKLKNFKKRGFTIVQLTDVHIGNTIKRDFVEKLVGRVNALKPDLIVLTGDIIDRDVKHIREDLAPLKALNAQHGVYGVLGNHEYMHKPQACIDALESLGIKMLLNDAVVIDDSFNLVGVNDLMSERIDNIALPVDIHKAFSNTDNTLPNILLAHQPKMITKLEGHTPELILSGHTHGGQIFPFGLLVLLDQPYLNGLHTYNKEGEQIYISNGTGYWGPPIRVFARSEIALLEVEGIETT
jgi:predicted MPP superfamily phosphohydrolase